MFCCIFVSVKIIIHLKNLEIMNWKNTDTKPNNNDIVVIKVDEKEYKIGIYKYGVWYIPTTDTIIDESEILSWELLN